MPSKIRVLSENTINKIAAGEVIENPASVIKELVENSIDASATEISIEILNGGRQMIRVIDNGCGMGRDDALLCLERHATSKIREVEDIYNIGTMGFRGEAIPSIAAISKFLMVTSEEENHGTMIIVEGGKLLQCVSAVRSKGTTIEVKSLFYNVPVRRKFQKSPSYDINEILKMVTSLSLGHPTITFQLINDQKKILSVYGSSQSDFVEALKERAIAVLGQEFVDSSSIIYESKEDITLSGLIGQPFHTRQNRSGQYLFVNNRAVQSPLVSFAIKEGYGTMLPTNRHPIYLVHLSLPGILVDVNVHPQKREVRLRQEQILKEMIKESINKALQNKIESSSFGISSHAFVEFPCTNMNWFTQVHDAERPNNRENELTSKPQEKVSLSLPWEIETKTKPPTLFPQKQLPIALAMINDYVIVNAMDGKGGVQFLDQKAAYARIVFERIVENRKKQEKEIETFLVPYSFTTTSIENSLLIQQLDRLKDEGIGISQTAPHTFVLESLPVAFGKIDLSLFIQDLLEALHHEEWNIAESEQLRQLAWKVSKASTHYHKQLSLTEAQKLIEQLFQCQTPYQCPLGKPLFVHLTQDDIAKKFQKISSKPLKETPCVPS